MVSDSSTLVRNFFIALPRPFVPLAATWHELTALRADLQVEGGDELSVRNLEEATTELLSRRHVQSVVAAFELRDTSDVDVELAGFLLRNGPLCDLIEELAETEVCHHLRSPPLFLRLHCPLTSGLGAANLRSAPPRYMPRDNSAGLPTIPIVASFRSPASTAAVCVVAPSPT